MLPPSTSAALAHNTVENKMFIAYNSFTTQTTSTVEPFADPKTFPAAFTNLIKINGVWNREILIDDGYEIPTAGTLSVAVRCFVFYAKDKATLKDGLKACPPSCKIVGEGDQIGFFCGSYDFEKLGAWFRTQQKSSKSWDTIESERRYGMADHLKGLTKGRHDTHFNRVRLTERGYFMFVCRNGMLANVRNARKMIGSEVALSVLGRMISGGSPRMTREQALGVLMDDLLVA